MLLNIFDIKHFALHDGPGIRTTIFLKGCPLCCQWCHNPESISPNPESVPFVRTIDGKDLKMMRHYGEQKNVDDLLLEVMKDIVFYDESSGGLTLSGGEPMMQPQGARALLEKAKDEGIHTAIDTSGYAKKEQFKSLLNVTDLFLYDLKMMDPLAHKKYTGVDNVLIHSNADYILGEGKHVTFRIPMIPGINDTPKEQELLMEFLAARKEKIEEVHVLPYHDIGADKYCRLQMDYAMKGVKEPSAASVEEFRNNIESCGIRVAIGG